MTTTTSTPAGTASTNVVSALGGGSGIDIKTLAQNLTEAERAPRKQIIQGRIDKCNATISGDGAVLSALSALKSSFAALQSSSALETSSVQTTDTSAFLANATSAAAPGFHQIEVLKVAAAQRSISTGYTAGSALVNGGAAFDLTITPADASKTPVTVHLAAGSTVNQAVAAINSAGAGVGASLVNTGTGANPFQVVLTAEATGTIHGFTLAETDGSGPLSALGFSVLTAAADARVKVDGVTLVRPSNDITDAITGLTINVFSASANPVTDGVSGAVTGASPTFVQVTRDTAQVKQKIAGLVAAYNDLQKILNTVSDASSSDKTIGGSLVSDSMVARIRNQARSLVTGPSSSAATAVNAFRDMGIAIQLDGMLEADDVKLQSALDTKYTDVVKALTANISNPSVSYATKRGLAGDAVKILTALTDTNVSTAKGAIFSSMNGAKSKIKTYTDDLAKLETRMAAVQKRYIQQFAIMDSIVGQVKSQQTGLTSTFAGLSAMYSNK